MTQRQTPMIAVSAFAIPLMHSTAAFASGDADGGSSLFTGDLGNIIWTLLTFLMVLVVVGKFAWKPILGALKNREDFIRDSLTQAKKEREEAQVQLAEYQKKLDTARSQATDIVDEGRRDAEVVKQKIEDDAKAEAAAMLERAKREISLATDTAVKQLYTLSANLATNAASRIIKKELDPKEHERLVAESIAELGGLSRN